MHKISDEFEFRPDRTTDYGVSCPWASKKIPIDLQWENAVSMLARSFLIESSSKLLVTRTGIKARKSLISGRIRLLTLELLALEWRKFYTFKLEYLWDQLANLDQILYVAWLGVGKASIMFWGRLGQPLVSMATESPHWLIMGKWCLHLFSVAYDRILFILAGNEDMHKISDEFEFRPDRTTDYGVSCPWASKKFPIDL